MANCSRAARSGRVASSPSARAGSIQRVTLPRAVFSAPCTPSALHLPCVSAVARRHADERGAQLPRVLPAAGRRGPGAAR